MGNVMLTANSTARMTEPIPACFSCTLQVSETIHVKCFECRVTICMLCFQCGAESPPHRRGHNYELVEPTEDYEASNWTHDDEFELLKAAHKFKMGNWGEIAENMGRGRTEGQSCKDYFEKNFVRGWIGQYSIKNSNWDRIKYGMYINQTLDSVLQKNCQESTERMLLIRDAIRHSGEEFDENDPKLATKIQHLLEQYVRKCIDNEIDIKYERPKILSNQFETELSPDECDPDDSLDTKPRKSVKLELQTDDSDIEGSPGPSCSYRKNGPPSPKKRKTTRIVRESSSDSEEDGKSTASDNDNTYHGLERETEDEDQSAFETAHEFDTDDEEEEKKPRKTTTPSTNKRKKRKRLMMSKKERRLHAFRTKMNRDLKKSERKLAGLSGICSMEEVKELRSAYPRLLLENSAKNIPKAKIGPVDNLNLLGYNADREEFETEWFNDAEQLISRLTITPAPAEKDQKLDIDNDIKFARLRQYVRILGIRKAKRNTILEHDKINEFFKFYKEMVATQKTPGEILPVKTEKEKILAMTQQFLNRDEYQALLNCIERIDGITERIEVLQELQRSGETTLKNAPSERKTKKKLKKTECEQRKRIATEWTKYKKWHTSGFE